MRRHQGVFSGDWDRTCRFATFKTNESRRMIGDWEDSVRSGHGATSGACSGEGRNVYCLLGLPFDAVDMNEAARRIRQAAASRTRCILSTPNLNFVVASRADAEFRGSVINSDLVIADGMPIVWVARLLGLPLTERVSGSGLIEELMRGRDKPLSVYFFGGPAGVAETASRRLNERSCGLTCVGFRSPGFGTVEDMSSDEIVNDINASGADFLIVSLGARKGQAWIERNRARLTVPVVSHLGAVVNFVAGTVKRAPHWMQKIGLEWLWRIREEPALWRRYVGDGVALLGILAARVLPFAWSQWRHRPPVAELAGAQAAMEVRDGYVVIRLRGPWTKENLAPLRRLVAEADGRGVGLRVDMADVGFVDSAFIGLMQLLLGQQSRQGRRFWLTGVNESVRRAFRLDCAEFVLEGPVAAGDG